MFSKLALFAAATMAVFVAAAPAPQSGINNSCNTGPVQCCNQLLEAEDEHATFLASLLGIVTGPISGQAGVQCSPLTLVGLGSGAKCNTQPVCCTNNQFNGVINFGCSPVNLGL